MTSGSDKEPPLDEISPRRRTSPGPPLPNIDKKTTIYLKKSIKFPHKKIGKKGQKRRNFRLKRG